jgi:hypothetical protein
MDSTAQKQYEMMAPIIALTEGGEVTVLTNLGSTEDFIVSCMVAQNLAHRLGKTKKQSMSVDDLIESGGLAQRLARQTVYNTTSALTKAKILQKQGHEFFVTERTVLQFFATKFPQLTKRNGRGA